MSFGSRSPCVRSASPFRDVKISPARRMATLPRAGRCIERDDDHRIVGVLGKGHYVECILTPDALSVRHADGESRDRHARDAPVS